WNLRLPSPDELGALKKELLADRNLSDLTLRIVKEVVGQIKPMRSLEMAVIIAGAQDAASSDLTNAQLKVTAARLTALMPTVLATYHRLRQGLEPVPPRDDLGHSANFLYMLNGREPNELESRVFDVAMILHAEHEMNASTFSALVTASTL